ncbi:HSP70/90 co-chaperone [Dimargaris verticillata]|uniref:HSP70/90 co-chaperone n=1 Tax=Dimargaris verticillata TaxID=2761393 RepID=A0A9W8B791_9FUNG|nr:HSP70/90 co-chaperone [Dimargaris verticillata]
MDDQGPAVQFRSVDDATKYKPRAPDEFLTEMMQSPLFMKGMDQELTEEDAEKNPTLAALQSLAFEGSPTEVATNFKNQGNECFREGGKRKYRDAIAYYTKAIQQDCDDRELTATCYTNRAAVNLSLQNYRRAILDCKSALEINPKNVKALYRSARACLALEKFEEAIECCKWGLAFGPDNKSLNRLLEEVVKAESTAKAREAKRLAAEAEAREQQQRLTEALAVRNVRMSDQSYGSHAWDKPSDYQVKLDPQTNQLVWPVALLYPEFKQSDFIPDFDEMATFRDHLTHIFAQPAPWDPEHYYRPDALDVYFEYVPTATSTPKLLRVGVDCSLQGVLGHSKYTVVNGIPSFIILSPRSPFTAQFLKQYQSPS